MSTALMRLPELLYRGIVGLRNRYYDRPGAALLAELPVISVGNLTVGGTGKTPLVAWLADHVRSLGLVPAVVSRGYAGRAGKGPLLVSRGGGPLCEAARCGDEPYLLARALPGSIVVVGSDRVAGAAHARREGAQAVILDDGFQHRRLARDLDIVLLDADRPFDNGRVLPAGLLREPLSGLARAGLVVITRARAERSFPEIERAVRRHNRSAQLVCAGSEAVGFVDRAGRPAEAPERAVGFCGIGRPERFRADLASGGVELVGFRAFRDHHGFTRAELAELARLAGERRAALATTEKDLVRLPADWPSEPGTPLVALRIRTVVHRPLPLVEAVARALRRRGT